MMGLLYEMKPDLVERALIIPHVEGLERLIGVKNHVGITHYTRYIKSIISAVEVSGGEVTSIRWSGRRRRFTIDLIEFIFTHCGHLVGMIDVQWGPFLVPSFLEASEESKQTRLEASKLTYRDSFIRDFAAGSHIFSIAVLERLLEIKNALIEKHRTADLSLEEILQN